MDTRPSKHIVFLKMAQVLSERGTCSRRKVGAIFIDSKNRIVASGYNGKASGLTHCIYEKCPGADCASGEGLDMCEAIHAEQNALMQCKDIDSIYAAYVTTAPCLHCVKMLLNTGCRAIYFNEPYANAHTASSVLWESVGRHWEKVHVD